MRVFAIAAALAALTFVAGCEEIEKNMSTPAEARQDQFQKTRRALLDDPNARNTYRAQCMADANLGRSKAERAAMARRLGTSTRNLRSTFCDRLLQGVISGRITYRDAAAARAGRVSPEMSSVLQVPVAAAEPPRLQRNLHPTRCERIALVHLPALVAAGEPVLPILG